MGTEGAQAVRSCRQDGHTGGRGCLSAAAACRCVSLHGPDLHCVVPVEHLTFLPWSEWRESVHRLGDDAGLIAGSIARCCCGCLLDFKEKLTQ